MFFGAYLELREFFVVVGGVSISWPFSIYFLLYVFLGDSKLMACLSRARHLEESRERGNNGLNMAMSTITTNDDDGIATMIMAMT